MQSENKRTIYGAGLGIIASGVGHLVVIIVATLLFVALARIGTALVSSLITPEISEAAGLSVAVFLLVGFPIWMMGLVFGVDLAATIVQQLVPLALAVALLVGLASGGIAGRFLGHPIFAEKPLRQGAKIGLLANLVGLLLICLFTSWAVLILLPYYVCAGPVVGVLAVVLVRRFLGKPRASYASFSEA